MSENTSYHDNKSSEHHDNKSHHDNESHSSHPNNASEHRNKNHRHASHHNEKSEHDMEIEIFVADRVALYHHYWTASKISVMILRTKERQGQVSDVSTHVLKLLQNIVDDDSDSVIPQIKVWELLFVLNNSGFLRDNDPWALHGTRENNDYGFSHVDNANASIKHSVDFHDNNQDSDRDDHNSHDNHNTVRNDSDDSYEKNSPRNDSDDSYEKNSPRDDRSDQEITTRQAWEHSERDNVCGCDCRENCKCQPKSHHYIKEHHLEKNTDESPQKTEDFDLELDELRGILGLNVNETDSGTAADEPSFYNSNFENDLDFMLDTM